MFKLSNTKSFVSTSNVYQNCQGIDNGAIFNLQNVKFYDSGSVIKNSQALNGGAFYCDSSILSFT